MSSTAQTNPKTKKRGRQDEGGGPPQKRSITQQLLDDVLRGIPWDDDLSGAATGLSREEERSTCEMEQDILEMARDADRESGQVGWCLYVLVDPVRADVTTGQMQVSSANTTNESCDGTATK